MVDTFARDHLPPRSEWPEFLFDRPEYRYPQRLNCVVELLDRRLELGDGERTALTVVDNGVPRHCSYAQLAAQVNRIANVLTEDCGLIPGNRVLLRAPNTPMLAACWLAVVKAGGIAVATMPLLRARELKPIIDKAQVRLALCDARLIAELLVTMDPASGHHAPALARVLAFNDGAADSLDALARAKPDTFRAHASRANDVCMIAFTSGTTGLPKGTMHFHRDVMVMADAFTTHVLRPTRNDVFCGTPPLAFTFGLGGLLAMPLRYGASAVLAEKLTAETLLATIGSARATICFTAPTMYRAMALALAESGASFDISSLAKNRVGRRSATGRDAPALAPHDRVGDDRRHRRDRNDPHLHLGGRRRRATRRDRQASARLSCDDRRRRHEPAAGRHRGDGLRSKGRPDAGISPMRVRGTTCAMAGM
jgi:2-aminobenzoate-CoA ligase